MSEVRRELFEAAPGPGKCVSRSQNYIGSGLTRVERRSVTSESDYANELYARRSEDNGRSWSPWENVHAAEYRTRGDRELLWSAPESGVYDPVHGHAVALTMQRLFLENHHESYKKYWGKGESTFSDHTFLWVSRDSRAWTPQLVKYEEGADFDDADWARADYVNRNRAYYGCNLEVLPNGEVIFPVGAAMTSCLRILGVDAREVFPSAAEIMYGLIVVRARWDAARGCFDFTPSRPVVISDLKSSRGCDENIVLVLRSGRIIVVFRGSNVISEGWRTRIQKGTPAHKWYTFSDDGGKTFSDPVPWHFDNGEVFYSPATISAFLRSRKTGKAYWFGNMTGAEAYGNGPRYPLVMAEVDEQTGFLKRQTVTVVDDRDAATESDKLQLSNFTVVEDRETGAIELYVTKLGANRDDFWRSDAYRYLITVS
jgi:hypothetical protein